MSLPFDAYIALADVAKDGDTKRTLSAIASALNPIRNRASLVHPNEELLNEPEAMLVLNNIRTLFNYVLAKVNAA